MTNSTNLSTAQLIALSLPTWVFAGYDLARRSFLAAYLSYSLALPIGTVGWLVMLSGMASIPAEILAGAMCDRGMRWFGPRVTWMLAGTVLLTASGGVILLLGHRSVGTVPIALALFTLVVGWAFCNITHGAWALEVSSDSAARARIFGLRSLAGIAGGVSFSLVGAVQAGRGWSPFTAIMLVVFVAAPIAHAGLIATLPDRAPAREPWQRGLLIEPLRLLFANRGNRRLAMLFALNGTHTAITSTAYLYLVCNALALPEWGATGLFVQSVTAAIGIATAVMIGVRLPATDMLRSVFLVNLLLAIALPFIPPAHPVILILWTAVFGLVSAVDFMALRVLLGERLNLSRADGGSNARATAFYAGFHLPYNLCAALAAGGLLLGYRAIGFNPGTSGGAEQLYVAAQVMPALCAVVLMLWSLAIVGKPSYGPRDCASKGAVHS